MNQLLHSLANDYRLHVATAMGLLVAIVLVLVLVRHYRSRHAEMVETNDSLALNTSLVEGLCAHYRALYNHFTEAFGPYACLYQKPAHDDGWEHHLKTIAVDLDGVILEYDGTWLGVKHFGQPIEGVKAGLETIRKLGFRIAIYTSRNNPMVKEHHGDALSLTRAVEDVLRFHEIPYDYISLFKPLAAYYIDDRAIRFYNWPQTIGELAIIEGRKRGYLVDPGPSDKAPRDLEIEEMHDVNAELAGCVMSLQEEVIWLRMDIDKLVKANQAVQEYSNKQAAKIDHAKAEVKNLKAKVVFLRGGRR
jgi:hypothetical protein